MLSVIVPALWIMFDVAICLRTGYMTAPLPHWEWWCWLIGGILLAGLAVVAGWWDREQAIRDATQRHKEIQSGQGVLAQGSMAILNQLAIMTQTTGQPFAAIIEAAHSRITALERQLADQQWRQIKIEQRQRFGYALQNERPEVWRIIYTATDSEAESYAKQLTKMIRDSGIRINEVPDEDGQERPELDRYGLAVLVKDAGVLAPNALALTRALRAADIEHHLTNVRVGRTAPDNYLALRIGPRSK
jgi:hypothetical protein